MNISKMKKSELVMIIQFLSREVEINTARVQEVYTLLKLSRHCENNKVILMALQEVLCMTNTTFAELLVEIRKDEEDERESQWINNQLVALQEHLEESEE